MEKTITLKENRDFLHVYRYGKSVVADCVVLYFKKNPFGCIRIGITCTKKVGKAVVRNRVKRKIKENLRQVSDKLNGSYDIVVVARVRAASCDYHKIGSSLKYLLAKARLIPQESNDNQ